MFLKLLCNIYKPQLEQIEPTFGASVLIKKFEQSRPNKRTHFAFPSPKLNIVFCCWVEMETKDISNHIVLFIEDEINVDCSKLPHYGFTRSD